MTLHWLLIRPVEALDGIFMPLRRSGMNLRVGQGACALLVLFLACFFRNPAFKRFIRARNSNIFHIRLLGF